MEGNEQGLPRGHNMRRRIVLADEHGWASRSIVRLTATGTVAERHSSASAVEPVAGKGHAREEEQYMAASEEQGRRDRLHVALCGRSR